MSEIDGNFLGLREERTRVTRMSIGKLTESKVGAPLIVTAVLVLMAWVSGVIALPSKFDQHESRITRTESEMRELRESGIRRDEAFKYIQESLARIERNSRKEQR